LQAVEAAGEKLGFELREVPATSLEEFEPALAKMTQEGVGGFLAVGSPLFLGARELLATLALSIACRACSLLGSRSWQAVSKPMVNARR
jgi:hypothetical protein